MKFSTILLAFVATVACNPIVARQATPIEEALATASNVGTVLTAGINGIGGASAASINTIAATLPPLITAITTAATTVAGTQVTPAQQAQLVAQIQDDITLADTLLTNAATDTVTALTSLNIPVALSLAGVTLNAGGVALSLPPFLAVAQSL